MTLSRQAVDALYAEAWQEVKRRRAAKSAQSAKRPIVDWIQSEFYIPELNGPMVLYPHQIAALKEALATDTDGNFKYDLVLWSDIAKSAKSTIAGAVVLWRALNTERGKFRIVANDLKQAASRVFDSITTCLQMNQKLGAQFNVNKYLITHLSNGANIEAVPVDPGGEAGGSDHMVEYTELHAAKHAASQLMWTETKLSPLLTGKAQRWIDSYAGYSGESPILEPLFQRLVKDENRISSEYPFYANGRSFAMWNTTPRLPWQTTSYYESEAQQLLPNEFERIHHNQWVSSTQSFIQIEWWDACKVAELPALNRYREVVVALDAAVSNDCFAICCLSRHDDKTALRYARRWLPVNGKIQYRNPADPADRDYPEGVLRWLCTEYNVVIVCYDPYQLHSFVTDLSIEGLAAFEEFQQEKPRLIADKALYDNIMARRIVHNGDFPDMREHLQNANSTAEDKNTLRIVKRSLSLKIDLAVALSMCDDRARFYLPE